MSAPLRPLLSIVCSNGSRRAIVCWRRSAALSPCSSRGARSVIARRADASPPRSRPRAARARVLAFAAISRSFSARGSCADRDPAWPAASSSLLALPIVSVRPSALASNACSVEVLLPVWSSCVARPTRARAVLVGLGDGSRPADVGAALSCRSPRHRRAACAGRRELAPTSSSAARAIVRAGLSPLRRPLGPRRTRRELASVDRIRA